VSPPVLPVNGSPLATPPFPRPGLDGLDSPASAVLRRRYDSPLRMARTLMVFASALHADLLVRARRGAPTRLETPCGPGQFDHSAVLLCRGARRVGEYGVSQVPWRSFPCLCQAPGPRSDPPWQAITPRQVLPPQRRKRGLRRLERFRGFNLASALAVYASRALSPGPGKTRFRLAG
jgi:hypothetical protein